MPKMIDLLNRKFGRLVVVAKDRLRSGAMHWICDCECGQRVSVSSQNLRGGKTSSCGCFQRELLSKRNATHGKSKTSEYKIWKGMLSRCNNPNRQAFAKYGGSGINVCDRWKNSFDAFIKDMGVRPSKTHTLDRINNEDGYSPENCRWATRAEQSRNRRSCLIITHNGESKTAAEWARELGLSARTVQRRAKKGIIPPLLFCKEAIC